MDSKSPLLSKTLWLNGITLLIALLGALAGQEWIKENPQWTATIGTAVAMLNIVNRFFTEKPVAFVDEDDYGRG